jgi:hypothetical protein
VRGGEDHRGILADEAAAEALEDLQDLPVVRRVRDLGAGDRLDVLAGGERRRGEQSGEDEGWGATEHAGEVLRLCKRLAAACLAQFGRGIKHFLAIFPPGSPKYADNLARCPRGRCQGVVGRDGPVVAPGADLPL